MEKVRLGIIGIGSMGTGHAGNVLKGMVPDMELLYGCNNMCIKY